MAAVQYYINKGYIEYEKVFLLENVTYTVMDKDFDGAMQTFREWCKHFPFMTNEVLVLLGTANNTTTLKAYGYADGSIEQIAK